MAKEKNKTILMLSILSVIILVGTISSFAYFMVTGNNKNEELNINTGTLALTFSDGLNSFTGELEFGGSASKTFSIQNNGTIEAKARIMWNDLVNTYTEGSLTYTLSYSETEGGPYTEVVVDNMNVPVSSASTKELLAGNLIIPVDKTYYCELTIKLNYLDEVDQTADLNALLSTSFIVEESNGKDYLPIAQAISFALANKKNVDKNSRIKNEIPNFANTAETDEGIFKMEDDYGTSYYYRGAVKDNYVKFGTWANTTDNKDKAGKPMYWRIIRVNGDGSIRMIYDGTESHENGESSIDRIALNKVVWNTPSDDTKYAGYMFGGSNGTASTKRVNLGEAGYASTSNAIYNQTNSNAKTQIENWYKTNLKNYDDFVADVIYCNDRGIEDTTKYLGYGNNTITIFNFRLRGHTVTDPKPTFICPFKNDSFTKTATSQGNGKLSQKVGLMTADEFQAAGTGSSPAENIYYYLYKGQKYWLLTSSSYSMGSAAVFASDTNNSFSGFYANSEQGIAPVISLTPEYFATLTGDGTITNPFREKGLEP